MKAYATIGDEPYTGFDDVLIPDPPLTYDAEKMELISKAAHLAFPIRDGIPIMLVSEARAVE